MKPCARHGISFWKYLGDRLASPAPKTSRGSPTLPASTLLKWLLCAATLSATAAGALNRLRVRIRR